MNFLQLRTSVPHAGHKKESCSTPQLDNDEQSQRVVTLMLGTVKQILLKTKNILDLLDSKDSNQNDDKTEMEIVKFNQYLKDMMKLAVLSDRPLNQQLAGTFVFRLCKDLNHWKFFFPFILGTISQVETVFQGQKTAQKFNIQLLYFITIKKINAEASSFVNQKRNKIDSTAQQSNKTNEIISKIDKIKFFQAQKQRLVKEKQNMITKMNQKIFSLYHGLQVESLHPIKEYYCDLSAQDNKQLMYKQQFKRNKRIQKDMAQFKVAHRHLLQKRQRKSTRIAMLGKNIVNSQPTTMKNLIYLNDQKQQERSTFNPKKGSIQMSGFAARRLRSEEGSSSKKYPKIVDQNIDEKPRRILRSKEKPRGAITLQPILNQYTRPPKSRNNLKLRL